MRFTESMMLPQNAVVLPNDEMRYVDGGVSLQMKRSFLNRSTCKSEAAKYVKSTGLSKTRIAVEIRAHALLYYDVVSLSKASSAIGSSSIARWIKTHANPVDIGGDSAARVAAFYALWAF